MACCVLIFWTIIEKLHFLIDQSLAEKSTKLDEGNSAKRINGIHFGKRPDRKAGTWRKSS